MSRIGKKAVKVPSAVKVELTPALLKLSAGPQSLTLDIHPRIDVAHDGQANEINVARKGDDRLARAMHGTTRALIANMIVGLTKGFEKGIHIYGTGYGVKQEGTNLIISVGYAQPAKVAIPQGITLDIATPNARGNDTPAVFTVKGANKAVVGQLAAEIRQVKPPEPYRGKGVRYADEVVKRKVGKAFASG